eukprot:1156042-Pelagomonas_calceolata.AAC.2
MVKWGGMWGREKKGGCCYAASNLAPAHRICSACEWKWLKQALPAEQLYLQTSNAAFLSLTSSTIKVREQLKVFANCSKVDELYNSADHLQTTQSAEARQLLFTHEFNTAAHQIEHLLGRAVLVARLGAGRGAAPVG